MVSVLADPRLYAFTGGEAPTLDELRARYREQVGGASADGREEWLNWVVRLSSTGAAIGFVQATIVGGSADIAWLIGTEWQGRGYASEAASVLVDHLRARGIATITAHVHPDHAASAAVARRLGLEPTETIEDGEVVWVEMLS